MNKLLKFALLIVCIVVGLNLLFWLLVVLNFPLIADLEHDGLILTIDALDYAMVFAHGSYRYNYDYNNVSDWYENETYAHFTRLDGERILTVDLLDQLTELGYNHIWVSMCETGDEINMYYYGESNSELWYDWVSKYDGRGMSVPVFVGVGFVRVGL